MEKNIVRIFIILGFYLGNILGLLLTDEPMYILLFVVFITLAFNIFGYLFSAIYVKYIAIDESNDNIVAIAKYDKVLNQHLVNLNRQDRVLESIWKKDIDESKVESNE